jgi:choline dehydrogenase
MSNVSIDNASHYDTEGKYYDTVIVGGGAAGCVLAARLSEDPGRRVLLLESGGADTDPAIAAPHGAFAVQSGAFNWSDLSVPQQSLGGRQVMVSSGHVLGGGGSINFLAWFRGVPLDYDGWVKRGMTGWGWDDVLPLFRRAEDSELGASAYHGTGGPVPVTTAPDLSVLSLAFITAGVEQGLDLNRDFNGARRDGVGLLYSNVRDGERVSAARGYLHPVLDRAGLTVLTGATARRVVTRNRAVTGVEYADAGGRQGIARSASVVLCAGTLRTPQLLMLSGIGPAGELAAAGIEVVTDLPGVGRNLHDHPIAAAGWPVTRGETWADATSPENTGRYAVSRRGPLASIGQAAAFLRCGPGAPAPDVQLTPMLMDFTTMTLSGFSCIVTLLTPASRGSVRLRPGDPHAAPLVDPAYLTDETDAPLLIAGLRRTLDLGSAASMSAFIGAENLPKADWDDNQMLSFVRDNLASMNHPVGTCRSGTDDASVVDPELRVHGIGGLHVADASIMPDIVRGNTHATAVMIGERAADLIR